ncbi:hypothetical protein [Chitiniphilus eburneus]|uniref:hypothetical protein n=1 Tax=Chitiniphilus eburneus TaxID=2571148 RepID=UPI0035CF954D
MDAAWWQEYLTEVVGTFGGALASTAGGLPRAVQQVAIEHYANSGGGAVSLAISRGATRIVLLGYDMQHTGGATHWHGDHPGTLGNAGKVATWPAQFERLRRRHPDIEIINASRETALTCFPRQPLASALRGSTRPPLLVHGMNGLGDNIYQRPLIAGLAEQHELYLQTPWPELYADLPGVRLVRPDTGLRTQAKHAGNSDTAWVLAPPGVARRQIAYGATLSRQANIPTAMAASLGIPASAGLSLPRFGPCPIKASRPIAVIRPVTLRSEWRNEARNPLPEYINAIAETLVADYHVVSVADLEAGQEWLVGDPPPAHQHLHAGELGMVQLLALLQHAAVVVGGVGWIVPACIAAGVPLFCVLGGQGGHNAPDKLTAPDMDTSKVGWAWPVNYCRCSDMRHRCDKRIPNLMEQWHAFRAAQCL